MTIQEITPETVHSLFRYDEETGDLYWKQRPVEDFKDSRTWRAWNARFFGKRTGYLSPSTGYLYVCLRNKPLACHRIIWMMAHGHVPDNVDHINGDRTDNRLCNLRNVSHKVNMRNAKRRKDNSSGVVGVYFWPSRNLYQARILGGGKLRSLGYFKTLDEAKAARKSAELADGFHENHGREA